MVSSVAGGLLAKLGYRVEFSSDGREAIEQYKKAKESDEPFDVVIMDLTIPGGMGGAIAVKKLLEIDPHVKAIVSSGYSDAPIMANFADYGFKSVITKPYRLSDLSVALSKIMSAKKDSVR
jgi:CheY-like chemotaxis protein